MTINNNFVFTTDPVLLLLLFLGLFLSIIIDLKIYNFSFMTEFFVILPFLLFVTPETISTFVPISRLMFSKKNKIINFSFSFLMLSFATFLYKTVSVDFLKVPVFTIGYLIVNLFLLLFYFRSNLIKKEEFLIITKSYLIMFTLSFLFSFAYIIPEVKKEYFLILFIVYSLMSYIIFDYIKEINVFLIEKIENKKLRNINENLERLKNFTLKESLTRNSLDEDLTELLKFVCDISGFKIAVMSLFDKRSGKVVRVAQHGLDRVDFEEIKKKQPEISEIMKYFNKRFENNDIYFIPKGVTLFDDELNFMISEERKIDDESKWNPLDLLLVPIKDENSNIIGYISLDLPESDLRPTSDELILLRFLSWVTFEFLKKTTLSIYWITENDEYMRNMSYSSFVKLCENIINNSEKVVLAYLDVDDFDKINLEKGPEFADSISSLIEVYFFEKFSNAIFYKISAESFIVFFQNVSKLNATIYMKNMLDWLKKKNPDLSLSIGISTSLNKQKKIFELIYEAKMALNIAKKSGGGRIHAL